MESGRPPASTEDVENAPARPRTGHVDREEGMKLTRILGCASFAPLALAMTMADGAQAADKYVVGVSNTLTGNGWREEMICSIKAEAQASGKVSKVIVANRNGGPSEQIADIRNLISAGANIIIINQIGRASC